MGTHRQRQNHHQTHLRHRNPRNHLRQQKERVPLAHGYPLDCRVNDWEHHHCLCLVAISLISSK